MYVMVYHLLGLRIEIRRSVCLIACATGGWGMPPAYILYNIRQLAILVHACYVFILLFEVHTNANHSKITKIVMRNGCMLHDSFDVMALLMVYMKLNQAK
ncbi:hypothetical protein RHGRI_022224 [Rhododendron griersonianum]|uniref:Uncharacterized protein n=1 Tax=Rhododendron griersonianum TaxID=479676 RepID=A0AAV6JTA1_9ERIC|nr:hypothetical protein RHGRI_022224 [Rhododendron griersonianum]